VFACCFIMIRDIDKLRNPVHCCGIRSRNCEKVQQPPQKVCPVVQFCAWSFRLLPVLLVILRCEKRLRHCAVSNFAVVLALVDWTGLPALALLAGVHTPPSSRGLHSSERRTADRVWGRLLGLSHCELYPFPGWLVRMLVDTACCWMCETCVAPPQQCFSMPVA